MNLGFEEVLPGENQTQVATELGTLLSVADYDEAPGCPPSVEGMPGLNAAAYHLVEDDEAMFLLDGSGPDPGLELGTLLVSRTRVKQGDTTHLISRREFSEHTESGGVWYALDGSNSFLTSSASEEGASGGPTLDSQGAVVGTNRMQCGLAWTDASVDEGACFDSEDYSDCLEFSVAGGSVPGPNSDVRRTWGSADKSVERSLLWDLSWISLDAPAPPGISPITSAEPGANLGASVVLLPGPTPGGGWLAAGAPGVGSVLLRWIGPYGPDPHRTQLIEGSERFGATLGAADLDGDGTFELIVGQPATESVPGSVVVYGWGGERWEWKRQFESKAPGFGQALAVGDFDGNACADLAVSAPVEDTLHVFRFSGKECGDAMEDVVDGGEQRTAFGTALAAADFDGDGLSELYVGAPGRESPALGITKWTGEAWDLSWQSAPDAERFGEAVAAFGTHGALRLAVGSPGSNEVRIGSATPSGWEWEGAVEAPSQIDEFGAALSAGPFGEVAIGALGDGGALGSAAAFVFSAEGALSRAPTTLLLRTEASAEPGDSRCVDGVGVLASLGSAVALGDPDGDGVADLYVGAPGVDRCSRVFEAEDVCGEDTGCAEAVNELNAYAVQAPDTGAVLGLRDPMGLRAIFGEDP